MKQYSAGDVGGSETNYFESYGNTVSQSTIVGTLLKFNKGDWLLGKDDEDVEVGTRYTAIMDRLDIGWIKWVDSKPEEQRMGKLIEGFKPPRRKDLGDDDEAEWDVDDTGKARDPWQFTNHLILRTPGTTGEDEDDLFTFAVSSRGGLNAIGDLCKVFGKGFRMRPDEWPIVELGVNKYKHSNKEFGIIKVPLLTVVGWESKVPAPKLAPPKAAAPAKRASAR